MSNFKPTVDQSEQIKLIQELKDLKELKKMTFQQIADITKENGEEVSLSTIKNVFSEEKNYRHDYTNTLLPIFNALSGKENQDDPVIQILQTRLEIKNENIRQLEERLVTKEKKYKDREQFYMNVIDHLQDEIKFKNEQIKHHNEAMDRKDATLKELYTKLLENN